MFSLEELSKNRRESRNVSPVRAEEKPSVARIQHSHHGLLINNLDGVFLLLVHHAGLMHFLMNENFRSTNMDGALNSSQTPCQTLSIQQEYLWKDWQ
jgi:hypothetical protein